MYLYMFFQKKKEPINVDNRKVRILLRKLWHKKKWEWVLSMKSLDVGKDPWGKYWGLWGNTHDDEISLDTITLHQ